MCSERSTKKAIYDAIREAAAPGDIVFIITSGLEFAWYQRVWRRWTGLPGSDSSKWHTALYCQSKKERHGATHRPYIVHSAEHGFRHTGTVEEHISPACYTSSGRTSTILEVASMRGLDAQRRAKIVEY